jgi:hypothetical protein
VSELEVVAHRGRADGAAATAADSGGSGDGRGPEEWGAPRVAREEEKTEEGKKGCDGARATLLYRRMEIGDGPAEGATW